MNGQFENKRAIDPAEIRKKMQAGDRLRLREISMQARKNSGLKHPDHLHAALAFGQIYREATERRRGSRTKFEDALREELRAEGLERTHIQAQKLKLPVEVTVIDETVRKKWPRKRKTPHRSLRHYLAAVRVVADMLGQDRESVQIAFLRNLPLWNSIPRLEVSEEHRDAADALCRLLEAMGRFISSETEVMKTIKRTTCQKMRWDPFSEAVVATEGLWMVGPVSPVHPVCACDTHITEMRPFPAVELLRIPMGWIDCDLFVEEGKECGATSFGGFRRAGEFRRRSGRMIQYRAIHLTLAPLNDRFAGSVLTSQDALVWRELNTEGYNPDRPLVGEGNWSDVAKTTFEDECFTADQQSWFNHEIQLEDGWHRVVVRRKQDLDWAHKGYDYGQDWEWDPIERPGEIPHIGRGYVTATRLTPDHVYHWFLQSHDDGGECAVCQWGTPDGTLAPPIALRCPPFTIARQIETALHDGRLETALRTKSNEIASQVAEVLESYRHAANEAEKNLIARWSDTAPAASLTKHLKS
ncbi:hypothetical protein KBW81_12895 [Loktanella salsilacus]|uniref:hypothetical protein n=1 Tax=Loktanella salsilacus TaxID=195913 RepID=UPI0020B72835|nr:hypothetical protein [Loktanella salsilacus]UTH47602.1 hypothetical protein KBW81_12895 [Loktanella salsilacus]